MTVAQTIPWSKLPSIVTWQPESEAFPADLSGLLSEAESCLGRSIQLGGDHEVKKFRISDIRVVRLQVRVEQLKANGREPAEFTNQWFVVFNYSGAEPFDPSSPNPYPYKQVAMLLDGTVANQSRPNVSSANKLPRKQAPDDLRSKGTSDSPKAEFEDTIIIGVWHNLQDPQIPISKVQWDPYRQPLPLDLRKEASRAKDYLKGAAIADVLRLVDVKIMRFSPVKAILARNEPLELHENHWYVDFSFRDDSSPRIKVCHVNMLLDGTIVPGDKPNP